MAVPPGLSVPTFKELTVWVQALSEYTARLTVVIVPFRGRVWLLLRIAAVVRVSARAVIVRAIMAMLGIFLGFILWSTYLLSQVVSINKH